jgi:hypothetical protein
MIMRRGGGFSSFHPKWTVETKRIPKINVFLQVFEDTVLAPNTVGLIDGQLGNRKSRIIHTAPSLLMRLGTGLL